MLPIEERVIMKQLIVHGEDINTVNNILRYTIRIIQYMICIIQYNIIQIENNTYFNMYQNWYDIVGVRII